MGINKHFKGNGTGRTLLVLILAVTILTAFRCIPPITIAGYEVKELDILSDLYEEKSETDNIGTFPSSMPEQAEKNLAIRHDSFPKGMTGIEDFSTPGSGMDLFYRKLEERSHLDRPVRIAYFGDSFIEGDILTCDLRRMLQSKFGGNGVGFVDIASPFTKLKPTVAVNSNGWTEYNVLDKNKGYDTKCLGPNLRYAIANGGAWVELSGMPKLKSSHLDSFDIATLYVRGNSIPKVNIRSNGKQVSGEEINGTGQLKAITYSGGKTGKIRFTLSGRTTAIGVALEGKRGVALDNFSLRGSSGVPLEQISEEMWREWGVQRPYDLIVVQYGLNVASKKQTNYSIYIKQMTRIIERLKAAYPNTAILVVSIGDREDRVNGQLKTMKGVKALVAQQRNMAASQCVAFWNLYEAMGGEGSIKHMAEANPPEAGKDYTHINWNGGKRIAGKLYKALMWGFDQYTK